MQQIFDENKALTEIVNSVTRDDEQKCIIAVHCFPENQIEAIRSAGHFVHPEGFTNMALAFSIPENAGKNSWKTVEAAKAELESDGYKVFEGKDLKETLVMLFKYKISIIGCFSDTETKGWLERYDKCYEEWLNYKERKIQKMTIQDVAKKYNISYGGNVFSNDDGSVRIGNLSVTEAPVVREGDLGNWVIPLEEGIQVLLEKGSGIWLSLTDKDMMQFLKKYLTEKGFPVDRILE